MNKIVSHTNKYFFIENIHVHFTNKLFLETNKTCTQDDQTSIERKEVGDDMWGHGREERGGRKEVVEDTWGSYVNE